MASARAPAPSSGRLGIETIGQLAAADVDMLIANFGESFGRWLTEAAHGRDERPVVTERAPKSISRETTFEHDLDPQRDRDALSRTLLSLCESLARDLQRIGYAGKGIGIKLRYSDFDTVTRSTTLEHPTSDPQAIRRAARAGLKRVALDRKVRLLGVRVAGLVRIGDEDDRAASSCADEHEAAVSMSLFD